MVKKIIVILAFVTTFSVVAFSQPRAIGGRIAYGVGFSYQHEIGDNMINADFELPGFQGIGLAATYDWIFPINGWNEAGSWNWYAGVGASAGFRWAQRGSLVNFGYVGIAGRIGVEYNFDQAPVQLSLDWRPIIGPSFNSAGAGFYLDGLYASSIAIGCRYVF